MSKSKKTRDAKHGELKRKMTAKRIAQQRRKDEKRIIVSGLIRATIAQIEAERIQKLSEQGLITLNEEEKSVISGLLETSMQCMQDAITLLGDSLKIPHSEVEAACFVLEHECYKANAYKMDGMTAILYVLYYSIQDVIEYGKVDKEYLWKRMSADLFDFAEICFNSLEDEEKKTVQAMVQQAYDKLYGVLPRLGVQNG